MGRIVALACVLLLCVVFGAYAHMSKPQYMTWYAHDSHITVVSVATVCPDCNVTVMIVCGIHGRELLTARLCEHWKEQLENDPRHSLVRFVLVPRLNEAGLTEALTKPCWRGNANGVDLNRNWPPIPIDVDKESRLDNKAETRPGPRPLSEPETEALRLALRYYRPHILLAVHSGAEAILYPYDANTDDELPNKGDHIQLANWIKHGHCDQCEVARSQDLLYSATGTLTDYWYWYGTSNLALTLEIYGPQEVTNATTCQQQFQPESAQEQEAVIARWSALLRRFQYLTGTEYQLLASMTADSGKVLHE